MSDPRPRLYLITPPLADFADFEPQLAAALEAGDVACLLVRLNVRDEGEAKKILRHVNDIAQPRGVAALAQISPGLVTANLALRANCDGVHFPAGLSPEFEEALKTLQPDRIVGLGHLGSKDDAMHAGEAGADYLLFGEPTADGYVPDIARTLERVAWWAEIFNVPCVGYADRLPDVAALAAAGAEFVALGAAVWEDPRGPAAAVAEATKLLAAVPQGAGR